MKMKNTQVASASTIGIAKRALAGNCTNGMISVMLLKKMKKNIAVRYGNQYNPSTPIVCMMIWLRTNATPDSAVFCTMPDGTRASLRRGAGPEKTEVGPGAGTGVDGGMFVGRGVVPPCTRRAAGGGD